MAILTELSYQEQAAYERFQRSRDEYAAMQQRLQTESVETIEAESRVETRRDTIDRRDTLAFERILDKNDLLSVNYLVAGQQALRPVCRIHVRTGNGRNGGYGTGFLVSPTLVLTNHHVLESQEVAVYSLAEFDYENDLNFVLKNSQIFRLEPERFFYNHRELDLALVAIHPESTEGTPLSEFGFFRLIEDSGKALIDEPVTIIQHPRGEDKQIALRSNRILGLVDSFIHYETDTLPGSSGSPVLNDQWQVVALHHAGVPRRDRDGHIMAKDGHVWQTSMGDDQIDWIANEGVRISAICNHLRTKTDWQPHELQLIRDLLHNQ